MLWLKGHKGGKKRFRRKQRVENWINFDLKKKKNLTHSSAVDILLDYPFRPLPNKKAQHVEQQARIEKETASSLYKRLWPRLDDDVINCFI